MLWRSALYSNSDIDEGVTEVRPTSIRALETEASEITGTINRLSEENFVDRGIFRELQAALEEEETVNKVAREKDYPLYPREPPARPHERHQHGRAPEHEVDVHLLNPGHNHLPEESRHSENEKNIEYR